MPESKPFSISALNEIFKLSFGIGVCQTCSALTMRGPCSARPDIPAT